MRIYEAYCVPREMYKTWEGAYLQGSFHLVVMLMYVTSSEAGAGWLGSNNHPPG